MELTEDFQQFYNATGGIIKAEDEMLDETLDPKLMAIVRALEALTGRKINISFMSELKDSKSATDATKSENAEPERLGWGIDYKYEKKLR